MVTGIFPSPPYIRPFTFIAHRVSIAFPLLLDSHRMSLIHALAVSACDVFVSYEWGGGNPSFQRFWVGRARISGSPTINTIVAQMPPHA